uniref:Activin_recp domain-containing protein n=1 Tax=Heterorhabditis bacteriophora TaxID=37862 RepID=A0A1I7XKT0_HETBA
MKTCDIHGVTRCTITDTTAREFFSAQRQELEPSRLAICGCHSNLCNFTPNWLQIPSPVGIFTVFVSLTLATVI